MNSSTVVKLHVKSSVVSETGFYLYHLEADEIDQLKLDAKELREIFESKRSYNLTNFTELNKSVKLIKSLFVDINAFSQLQLSKKTPVVNIELINDMISIAKGEKVIVPIELRVSAGEDFRSEYPELKSLAHSNFLWLDTAFKTNFSQLIKRTLYVLGEHNES